MIASDVLPAGSRVIEYGPTDPDVAVALREAGVTRYLGLVEPHRLDFLQKQAPDLTDRFVPIERPDQFLRCSTDLLMLRADHVTALWRIRGLRHVRLIAVEMSGRQRLERVLLRAYVRRTGFISPRGPLALGGRTFEMYEVVRRAKPQARRYLSPVSGVTGLGDQLRTAGVRYAVLRWYDSLPNLEPGEDLDVLVADDDVDAFDAILQDEPGTIPVDVYTESGLPGSDFHSMAYYPPDLARELLGTRVHHHSGLSVLDDRHHLLALAYHAVYHKGPHSGVPSTAVDPAADPEHDYAKALHELADRVGVQLDLTLEGLDSFLASQGWRPALDTRHRLAQWNGWLATQLPAAVVNPPTSPEPAVFLVRERLTEVMSEQDILTCLTRVGFEVLATRRLVDLAQLRTASRTRGGNWERGPFPTSGGPPVLAVFAMHYAPKPVSAGIRDRYPRLTNGDCLRAKEDLRKLVGALVPAEKQFNPIHSSDTVEEAWEYASLAMPDLVESLQQTVATRSADYEPDAPIVRELSRGRRARVDVVRTDNGTVVRKTYAKGSLAHLQREVEARDLLGPVGHAFPPLLAVGDNWFDCPYYQNTLRSRLRSGQLVPLRAVRGMVDVIRQVDALGFDLVDAKPDNFLLDANEGLKIVDLEFLYRKSDLSRPFSANFAFSGVPASFDGDRPYGEWSYQRRWLRPTGLSLEQLTSGSVLSQHGHRTVYRAGAVAATAVKALRRSQQLAAGVALQQRAPLARRLKRWVLARGVSA